MNMIEVDPKLFVTCRLCLEDMGLYQIAPSVQQQIKYCFDINVEPFDGLPQLICKKCESILSEYYVTKKKFLDKQTALRTKLEANQEKSLKLSVLQPQQETVTSTQQTDNDNNNQGSHRSRTPSNSSASTARSYSSKRKSVKKNFPSWLFRYSKQFVCFICNKTCPSKSAAEKHERSHKTFILKYENILQRKCVVSLNKTDKQPNITGQSTTVVYDEDKIIETQGNHHFYLMYTPKRKVKKTNFDRSNSIDNSRSENLISSDSSDDDMFVKRHKRLRLLSKSSNETVIINRDKSPLSNDDEVELSQSSKLHLKEVTNIPAAECINIDDSDSENESRTKYSTDCRTDKTQQNLMLKKLLTDYSDSNQTNEAQVQTIQNIVSMCHKKYLKRFDSLGNDSKNKNDKLSTNIDSQLKHKVLSIGIKVIKKPGILNCNGLLRFLEHKNLKITWNPNNINKETNFVRVTMRERISDVNDSQGWQYIFNYNKDVSDEVNNEDFNDSQIGKPTSTIISSNASVAGPMITIQPSTTFESSFSETLKDRAILYVAETDVDANSHKILNASPVANPKQLPKKSFVKDPETVEHNLFVDLNGDENYSNMCMPIITSTTSLASLPLPKFDDSDKDKTNTSEKQPDLLQADVGVEKSTPRIKVKPVSELMSERALNNISQQKVAIPQNMWDTQLPKSMIYPKVYTTNLVPGRGQPMQAIQVVSSNNSNVHRTSQESLPTVSTQNNECVMLSTVELPNCRTNSPFKYFQNLLNMHNIIFLETNAIQTQGFTCLLKFKLLFKQNSKDVTLSLSLLCSGNKFCLKIMDSNYQNIDINKLSANWQWEILKVYKGDIVNNLLSNAQKISRETYEYTNSFVCLLRSINFHKEVTLE